MSMSKVTVWEQRILKVLEDSHLDTSKDFTCNMAVSAIRDTPTVSTGNKSSRMRTYIPHPKKLNKILAKSEHYVKVLSFADNFSGKNEGTKNQNLWRRV